MFEFEIPDFKEITPAGRRMLLEVQIKSNGIWRVYKNDADTVWPSDFHAHNVDPHYEVLDLYTGYIYDKRTRSHVRSLPLKARRYLQNEIFARCKEEEIIQKCRMIELS